MGLPSVDMSNIHPSKQMSTLQYAAHQGKERWTMKKALNNKKDRWYLGLSVGLMKC
jgi:hypothetical protein